MPNPESNPSDDTFRAIEAEFHARPEHRPVETAPPLITMPTELEFQQQAAAREARENAERERRAAAHKEWFEKEKRNKRVSRLKKVMAATAVVMTFKSGGFIDMTGDYFSDAGNIAADAIEAPSPNIPDELDGIKFEDYPKAAQQERIAEEQARVEKDSRARDAVVGLFSELDQHGSDNLLREVEQYKADHTELFASREAIDAAKEQIDDAHSNDETITALHGFMYDQYGIDAKYGEDGWDNEVPFDEHQGEVKDIAKAYVEVFGALPKDFVALAKLNSVQVTNSRQETSDEGTKMGEYSPDEGEIRMIAHSAVTSKIIGASEKLPFIAEGTYESVVAHELGHAFDEQLILPVSGTDVETNGMDAAGFLEFAARELILRPELPTTYAATDSGEHTAEVLSGLLSRSSDGLADPDEWRRFGSESNKNMIRMLAQLEAVYPGIAKILIANRA